MQINRQQLLNTLIAVQPAITTRETYTQSSFFCFKCNRVYSYNNELAVSAPTELDFECAVPAQEFINIVNKMNNREIDITLEDNELIIEAGKTTVGLKIQQEVKIPIEHFEKDESHIIYPLPENFKEALAFCNFTASKDRSKPKLCNVHVKDDYVESCDNLRVTRFTLDKKVEHELLIPVHASTQLVKYSPLSFYITQGWMHFVCEDDVHFSCRIDIDNYVDVSPFLRVRGEEIIFPDDMTEGLVRAGIMLKGQDDEKVEIIVGDGILTVVAEGKSGWFNEDYEIDSDIELNFVIHPDFLKTILKVCNTGIVGENLVWFKGDNFVHAVVQVKE